MPSTTAGSRALARTTQSTHLLQLLASYLDSERLSDLKKYLSAGGLANATVCRALDGRDYVNMTAYGGNLPVCLYIAQFFFNKSWRNPCGFQSIRRRCK